MLVYLRCLANRHATQNLCKNGQIIIVFYSAQLAQECDGAWGAEDARRVRRVVRRPGVGGRPGELGRGGGARLVVFGVAAEY